MHNFWCMQEAEELPKDFSKLLDEKQFEYHTNLIPSVEALYKKLGVKHAPLTLIKPEVTSTTPIRLTLRGLSSRCKLPFQYMILEHS